MFQIASIIGIIGYAVTIDYIEKEIEKNINCTDPSLEDEWSKMLYYSLNTLSKKKHKTIHHTFRLF